MALVYDERNRKAGDLTARHEDATAILPEKCGLPGGINDKGTALLNTDKGAPGCGNEVNFHTK